MFAWVFHLFDRLCAAAGAIVFSQAPIFMSQYGYQLQGHLAELRLQLSKIEQMAAMTGKTVNEYIGKFTHSSDLDFLHQGQYLQNMLERYSRLQLHEQALSGASPWIKPYVFFSQIDWDIATATYRLFQPGLSFTIEGLTWAMVGFILSLLLVGGMRKLFVRQLPLINH